MEKKIYIMEFPGMNKIYSESKEEMLKAWEALNLGKFSRLRSEHDWDDDEIFYWPGEFRVVLESRTVYLHENEERAKKAKVAYKHAKKVGIISKRKKKT